MLTLKIIADENDGDYITKLVELDCDIETAKLARDILKKPSWWHELENVTGNYFTEDEYKVLCKAINEEFIPKNIKIDDEDEEYDFEDEEDYEEHYTEFLYNFYPSPKWSFSFCHTLKSVELINVEKL